MPTIQRIGLYEFDYREDHTHQRIGFVADKLEEIDSKFAIGGGYNEDGTMNTKMVDEFYMMGYAIKGNQELCDWNVRTDARLDSVDAKYQSETATLKVQNAIVGCWN
ncbi:MAG: hypothetical protein Q4C77_19570 [Eubacteriales bacterium]|nr:hypothetical protein [Eubacteriales bacterium]